MPSDAGGELKRLLRDEHKLVAQLPERDQQRFLGLLNAARQKQRDQVRTAQEHALRFVPALLRKPLLKLLGE